MITMNCAAGVDMVSTASIQEERRGSNPTAALHDLKVASIPILAAKDWLDEAHRRNLIGEAKQCLRYKL